MNHSIASDLILIAQYSDNRSRDFLVALVAIGLGLTIVFSVFSNREVCFELASVKTMDRNLGRSGTRMLLLCLGSLCLLTGIYLLGQASTNRRLVNSSSQSGRPSSIGVSQN